MLLCVSLCPGQNTDTLVLMAVPKSEAASVVKQMAGLTRSHAVPGVYKHAAMHISLPIQFCLLCTNAGLADTLKKRQAATCRPLKPDPHQLDLK